MMKLSKISKVILISGILLAFSCGSFATTAWADKNCEKQCETTYKGDRTQIKSCKAQCRLTDTQAEADAKIGSNGGKVTTYKTNGRTTGIKTSGGFGDVDDSGTITSANGTGAWEQAQINKNTAQSKYTDASTAYNKCVAQKGIAGCTAEKAAMNEARGGLDDASKAYNQAQKDASKAYYENEKAKAKAEKAEAKALKSDQKDLKKAEKALNKAEKALEKCQKKLKEGKVTNCSEEEKALTKAQTSVTDAQKSVDSHSSMVSGDGSTSELDKLKNAVTNAEGAGATDALNNLRIYKDNKEQAAKKAEEECERYSAMTSKDAQSKARQACAQAVKLRNEADAAAAAYSEVGKGVSRSGATAAEGQLKKAGKAGDAGVLDISESRQITVGGSGNDSLGGYRSNYFNYSADGDVLGTVTRRAALAVVSLKPIVYIFAGFGLIAFAWMAIFNKISWKWFANIAMGLFLVANMGRLIEYLVADDGANGGYYIGAWSNGAKAGGGANRLANAFKDSYYVYGDVQYHEKGVRDFVEGGLAVGSKSTDLFSASARGFCQGTSGSGFANFTSCMGDILSTVQKTTQTIQTVKATAEDMVARVEAVADTAKNIAQTAKNIAKAAASGDVTGVLANMGNMMNQANSMVSTTTGAVGSLTNAASTFSNNIQDLGKSTDQQAELANRRASGEATNKFDAMLKGQEWNSATGGVEKVDGQYAGQESWVSAANNIANTVKNSTATVTGMGAAMTQSVGAITNIVQTTSLKDLTGFGKDTTINDKIAHHQEKKAAQANAEANAAAQAAYQESNAGKNAAYREQNNATNQLYSNMQAQKSEVKNLTEQQARASKMKEQNCTGEDDESALCQASKDQLKAVEDALEAKKKQLTETETQYDSAKKELDNKYNSALESNINESKANYDAAKIKADAECEADPSGAACATARRQALEAANQYSSYVTEKEKQTNAGRYETKEEADTGAAGKNAAYREQNNITNQLYSNILTQQNEVKNLTEQEKKAETAITQNCTSEEDESTLCQISKEQLSATQKALDAKKKQLTETEKQYSTAKDELDKKYDAVIESNVTEAKANYDAAKTKADDECAANPSSAACATARRQALEAANQYSSYVKTKEELNELQSKVDKAKISYNAAMHKKAIVCRANPLSEDCKTATGEAEEAQKQIDTYKTEKLNAGRYETKEQVDTKIAENATIQERKRQDDKLKYEEEQAARQLQNEASNAKREYEQAVDNASNLYTQMNAQEQEAKELEQQAKTKAAEAQKACDRNSASSVCTTAQTAAAAAKKAVENKKEQIQQTKSEYAEAKKHAETAYNASVTAGAAQAQRDYDNAVNQQKRAKEIIAAADAQMGKASEQAKSAETDYNAAMKEAQAARKAYQEAQASGNSEDEIKRLKAEYDAKLDAKAAAEKEYQQKSKAYNDLKQQKKDAEKSYNDAYTKAKDAGGKLASYTNESVNKTGESRLDSREDVDNQALVNQYKSDTNPVALAQASKNNYIERQNNAAVAEERLREKQAVAAQAKKAYEDAVQKANASGSEADRRAADRLKNNYNLAENEVETAEQSYKKAVNELSGYEADYLKKAKEAETYKQSVYAAQMKQASEDINKYEAAVNKQLKVVDAAATAYTQAKGSASDNDPQKVQKAAQLYNDYKAAKETYDSYVKSLKQARNSYTDAQKKYQESKTAEKKL